MKKIIHLALVACVLSIISISCDNETEMLFDQTATERKTAAIDEYMTELKSADYGWIFQYYPEENQSYGGYNYVVKFDNNDSVAVWSELSSDLSQSVTSYFDIISYGGPVLTFNTYNAFMHYFATPSGEEYNAKGGDYEFLLLSSEDDVITIKGTKTGNTMRLIKLNEPAEDYLTMVSIIDQIIHQGSFNSTVDGNTVATTASNRNFTFTYEEDGQLQTLTVPYIVTKTGISFYEPVEVMGTSYQNFVLDLEDDLTLLSDVGSMSIQIVVPPVNLQEAAWTLDVSGETNCSEAVLEAWIQAYESNSAQWGETLSPQMTVGGVRPEYGDYGISFYSYPGPYRAHYNLSFEGVIGHPDYINIVPQGDGFNWQWYTYFSVVVNLITDNSPYLTETDDADNPAVVKLTSVSNPDVWFVLTTE